VTVRATYVAFRDLRDDYRPGLSDNEECHFLTFGCTIAMVELERDDVHFAAVHTWMSPQILLDKAPILISAPSNPIDLAGDVLGTIPEVMVPAISRMTRPAVVLACSERLVVKGECRNGLEKSAPDTTANRGVGL
jgi:hypothetical protein